VRGRPGAHRTTATSSHNTDTISLWRNTYLVSRII
jgi:hypothetical protein